jgi:hypothetical protein
MLKISEKLGLYEAITNPGADMPSLITEWQGYFGPSAPVDTSPDQLTLLGILMDDLVNGSLSCPMKLQLLEEAVANPLYGLTLVLAALPSIAVREAQGFWDLLFAEQTAASGPTLLGNFKELPAPGTETNGRTVKYLIVSDLHRDERTDDRGLLEFGSIDHFKANQKLYETVLDFAITKGYTLLEAGDCEELWFVRSLDGYQRNADGLLDIGWKMDQIIQSHPGVYQKLRTLNSEGRYYRTYGNHDSFLKPECANGAIGHLQAAIGDPPDGPLEIYDSFLIPGLKSMMEQSSLDIVTDALALASGQLTAEKFVEHLLSGRLGLDSKPYAVNTRMVVTHGHQFDFWNKPENEILGLLIANTVGMLVDRTMDPFLDMRGIAMQGNPWIEFEDAFAGWPVFNSWVSRGPSLRFAHQVQHMPNAARGLSDSIMFSESQAAFWGTFGIALDYVDGPNIITPAVSRATLDLTSPDGITTYLHRHHLHHICIGHTHNPHSQPYATIENLSALSLALAPIEVLLGYLIPTPKVKTTYFNSGTCGWMEGVIWAIEIDETGQARLVYWTDRGDPAHPEYQTWGPEYMDWELQPLPSAYASINLEEELKALLALPADAALTTIQHFTDVLKKRMEELNVAAADISAVIARAAMMPIHSLAAALLKAPTEISHRLRQLEEVSQSAQLKIDELKAKFGRLREFHFDVALTVKRHTFIGFPVGAGPETLIIKAPISSSTRERLERFKRILVQMGASEDAALHYAGMAIAMFDAFPRNVPFFSSMLQPLDPLGLLEASESPVLYSLLSTLWMYPPAGQEVVEMGVRIRSTFALGPTEVTLTVTIEAALE